MAARPRPAFNRCAAPPARHRQMRPDRVDTLARADTATPVPGARRFTAQYTKQATAFRLSCGSGNRSSRMPIYLRRAMCILRIPRRPVTAHVPDAGAANPDDMANSAILLVRAMSPHAPAQSGGAITRAPAAVQRPAGLRVAVAKQKGPTLKRTAHLWDVCLANPTAVRPAYMDLVAGTGFEPVTFGL
jgi:hypothetical protein